MLQLVDTLSSFILNITLLSLGLGSIVPLALSVLVALVCAVAMSTCCESVIFALFARPYELGDVVFLVSLPILPLYLADKKKLMLTLTFVSTAWTICPFNMSMDGRLMMLESGIHVYHVRE